MNIMVMENENLVWTGKSNAIPNFWGLNRDSRGLGFNIINGAGHREENGPLAKIFWALILNLLISLFASSIHNNFAIVVFSIGCAFIIFWFFIRELQYYQLTKNTNYYITDKKIKISQTAFGSEKIILLDREKVKKYHLVKYEIGDKVYGTILIYTDQNSKSFDLSMKEKTNLPRIEKVTDYDTVYNILINSGKGKNTHNNA